MLVCRFNALYKWLIKIAYEVKKIIATWKAFQNEEEKHFRFWNVFFRFIDIYVFVLCKSALAGFPAGPLSCIVKKIMMKGP